VNQKDANRPGLRKLRVTREYQPTNRRVNNFTRRRRFTSCRLSVDATSKKKSEKKYFRLLTFCQPYQRKNSGAPGRWVRNNRKAQTGVVCDVLFGII